MNTNSQSPYSYITNLESYDEYVNMLDRCYDTVSDRYGNLEISKESCLLLELGVYDESIEEEEFDELLSSYVTRRQALVLISKVFDVQIEDMYKDTDLEYGITRAEVLYLFFNVIPEALGINYAYSSSMTDITDILKEYYDFDEYELSKIAIIKDNCSEIILDINEYRHEYSMTDYIRGIVQEKIPVPIVFLYCYAEMLKVEIFDMDMLQSTCIDDMFQVETYETLSILISRVMTII